MKESETIKFFKRYGKCMTNMVGNRLFPAMILKDGTVLSVQASKDHSCEPCKNLSSYNYKSVEVVTASIDFAMKFSAAQHYMGTYGHISVVSLDNFISKHGGIDYTQVDLNVLMK